MPYVGPMEPTQPPPQFGAPQAQHPGPPPAQHPGPPPAQHAGPPPAQHPGPPPGPPSESWFGPPPGPPPPLQAAPRGRTRLTLLVALVMEVALIAAFDNQWLSEKIAKFEFRTDNTFLAGVAGSALTYSWRFTPRTGDTQRLWLSQMMLILAVLVFSALLIATVIRGPVTFGRAFFGTWMAVIVATGLGTIVRGLVIGDAFSRPGTGRPTYALFGALGPNAPAFVAGVGLGLVTALVVAVVASATRRAPAQYTGYAPPALDAASAWSPAPGSPGNAPWQDRNYGPPGRHAVAGAATVPDSTPGSEPTGSAPATAAADEATTQEPRVVRRDEQTTRLPRMSGDQATTAFPRPPNDEDLNSEHH
jgi:hypothetical protein